MAVVEGDDNQTAVKPALCGTAGQDDKKEQRNAKNATRESTKMRQNEGPEMCDKILASYYLESSPEGKEIVRKVIYRDTNQPLLARPGKTSKCCIL